LIDHHAGRSLSHRGGERKAMDPPSFALNRNRIAISVYAFVLSRFLHANRYPRPGQAQGEIRKENAPVLAGSCRFVIAVARG
jgi:hypothetical protein